MKQALLTVHYRISGDTTRFRSEMEHAAIVIAQVRGLSWKIWGFDAENGSGVSAYLFDNAAAAEGFATGPILARLRSNPAVTSVVSAFAAVDHPLSAQTGAAAALAR